MSRGGFAEQWDRAMRWLREYHRYEVVGAEHVPVVGPAVVASTHSLATYENFMLGSFSLDQIGRRPYILADDLMFRVPWIGDGFRSINVVPGRRGAAQELLASGELVGLGPGGMREAVRSSHRKYEFDWRDRLGFVWVSLLAGAPIILAACPTADEIYTVYETRATNWFYQRFHLPLPLFRGRGPTPLPRPVKLVHVIDRPIPPPVAPDQVSDEVVRNHHCYVVERMHELMVRALSISDEKRNR
jgi:hypothetical protein